MRGQKRGSALRQHRFHALPQHRRLGWIETGHGHGEQPQTIGLEFLISRIGQQQPELRPSAENGGDLVGVSDIADAEGDIEDLDAQILPGLGIQAALRVAGGDMADLVAHHGSELMWVLGDAEHAFEHADALARQRESVDLATPEQNHLPGGRIMAVGSQQAVSDRANDGLPPFVPADRRASPDLVPGLQAEGLDLAFRYQVDRPIVAIATAQQRRRQGGRCQAAECSATVGAKRRVEGMAKAHRAADLADPAEPGNWNTSNVGRPKNRPPRQPRHCRLSSIGKP